MTYCFKPSALKDIKALPKEIQKRIIQKLDFYISSPHPLIFAEKLADTRFGQWRFRTGDYRVIFDVKGSEIIILKIGHRREVYK